MRPIPTLKDAGYITSIEQALLYIFECFVTCEHSQSNYFKGMTKSLSYLIKSNPNEPENLASEVERVLLDRYRKYFEEVRVTVVSKMTTDDPAGPYKLEIQVQVTEEGKVFTLGNVLNDALTAGNNLLSRITTLGDGM